MPVVRSFLGPFVVVEDRQVEIRVQEFVCGTQFTRSSTPRGLAFSRAMASPSSRLVMAPPTHPDLVIRSVVTVYRYFAVSSGEIRK